MSFLPNITIDIEKLVMQVKNIVINCRYRFKIRLTNG